MKKRLLVATGGGDCPGLNTVLRAIVKRAKQERDDWEIIGSIDAFDGILKDPMKLMELTPEVVAGIHVKGGTIIGTTNKGGPFNWPVKDIDGKMTTVDRSDDLIKRIQYEGFDAVINIGGDGSQKISQQLFEKGCPIIGIPKTIDNDLAFTDFTFGFQTAVETATDAIGKLVTTAASHRRIFVLEVMGRDAGWIALHSSIAGGAEVCLIPEIPYDMKKVEASLEKRIKHGPGFAVIVIAEGAKPIGGELSHAGYESVGAQNVQIKGAGERLLQEIGDLKLGVDTRLVVLGHLQRGGTPIAFDRILASQFGVKAFEMALNKEFGQMVCYNHPNLTSVSLKTAIENYNLVDLKSDIINTARGVDINLGD